MEKKLSTQSIEKKTNLPTKTQETDAESKQTVEDVRKHVLTFGNSIHEYFEHVQAEVENYKFIVEKRGEGLEVDVMFKAFVHPKTNEATKQITT